MRLDKEQQSGGSNDRPTETGHPCKTQLSVRDTFLCREGTQKIDELLVLVRSLYVKRVHYVRSTEC